MLARAAHVTQHAGNTRRTADEQPISTDCGSQQLSEKFCFNPPRANISFDISVALQQLCVTVSFKHGYHEDDEDL